MVPWCSHSTLRHVVKVMHHPSDSITLLTYAKANITTCPMTAWKACNPWQYKPQHAAHLPWFDDPLRLPFSQLPVWPSVTGLTWRILFNSAFNTLLHIHGMASFWWWPWAIGDMGRTGFVHGLQLRIVLLCPEMAPVTNSVLPKLPCCSLWKFDGSWSYWKNWFLTDATLYGLQFLSPVSGHPSELVAPSLLLALDLFIVMVKVDGPLMLSWCIGESERNIPLFISFPLDYTLLFWLQCHDSVKL